MSVFPVHIEDVTVTAELGVSIPLDRFVSTEEGAEYEGEASGGVVYRLSEPKCTALVFSSGKVVCTGAKSIRDAQEAVLRVTEKIRGLGVEAKENPEIAIEQIVAAFHVRGSMNLVELASRLENARYDAKKLPAVVYRLPEQGADFLILENKIICTGGRSIKEVQSAMKSLKERLERAGTRVEFV